MEVLQRHLAKSTSSPSDHVILHHKQNIQKKENNLWKTVFTCYMFHVFPKKVKFKSESLIQDLVASSGQLLPAFQISSVWAMLIESENDKEDKTKALVPLVYSQNGKRLRLCINTPTPLCHKVIKISSEATKRVVFLGSWNSEYL